MSRFSRTLLLLAAMLGLTYLLAGGLLAWPLNAVIKAAPIWILAGLAFGNWQSPHAMPLGLALFFSGIGDFALSSPFQASFPLGMAAFFVAHIGYLWILGKSARPWRNLDFSRRLAIVAIALFAFFMGAIILPRTGALMLPIAAYFLILALMVMASFAGMATRWTRLGAMLFLLSDTLIGIDRFMASLEYRHLAVMGTYYAAQALIFAGISYQSRSSTSLENETHG